MFWTIVAPFRIRVLPLKVIMEDTILIWIF